MLCLVSLFDNAHIFGRYFQKDDSCSIGMKTFAAKEGWFTTTTDDKFDSELTVSLLFQQPALPNQGSWTSGSGYTNLQF